jgi:hypothetical protein
MNDFFGQPLAIGDEVAFMCPHYRHMIVGKIVKFTPEMIVINYTNHNDSVKDFRATPNQVIKKP